MLVKVNVSLAGADFTFNFGEEVEQEVFAARVGNGWESLCDPVADKAVVVETAVEPEPDEVALIGAPVETAVVASPPERRGRRR